MQGETSVLLLRVTFNFLFTCIDMKKAVEKAGTFFACSTLLAYRRAQDLYSLPLRHRSMMIERSWRGVCSQGGQTSAVRKLGQDIVKCVEYCYIKAFVQLWAARARFALRASMALQTQAYKKTAASVNAPTYAAPFPFVTIVCGIAPSV